MQRGRKMFKHIINQELELRILEHRHTEVVFAKIDKNRTHLSQWFPWVEKNKSIEDTCNFIKYELHRFANNNGFSAGIYLNDKYIGNISIHDIDWNIKMTTIGYWISSDFQGKGIMTMCCREVVKYGFEVLNLNKIEIRARSDNHRSIAIPERLGFTREGILRQVDINQGIYYDHVVYGILKDEWKSICK